MVAAAVEEFGGYTPHLLPSSLPSPFPGQGKTGMVWRGLGWGKIFLLPPFFSLHSCLTTYPHCLPLSPLSLPHTPHPLYPLCCMPSCLHFALHCMFLVWHCDIVDILHFPKAALLHAWQAMVMCYFVFAFCFWVLLGMLRQGISISC